jgi:hypothetical protein
MKKKKQKHVSPQQYRITWSAADSVTDSSQYYSVYHSSEALADIYHTFAKGKIHAKTIVISGVEEHNRFSDKWEDRMQICLEHFGNEFDSLVEKDCWVSLSVSDIGKIVLTK